MGAEAVDSLLQMLKSTGARGLRLAVGSPAEVVGYACCCGRPLERRERLWVCPACHESYDLPPVAAERRD